MSFYRETLGIPVGSTLSPSGCATDTHAERIRALVGRLVPDR